ncbi:alpha/beta hydrolase [uncultured Clostridium sp.]|uniref:alpha/beta hydrolase n=1 Tax=uncultured Clostridium sp. TaxID=59620 RepID=UPI0025DA28AE|nr:alpha/beta hydrolase [uncultured Clostridium sp.]
MIFKKFLIETGTGETGFRIKGEPVETEEDGGGDSGGNIDGSIEGSIEGSSGGNASGGNDSSENASGGNTGVRKNRKRRSGGALLTCFLKDNTDGKPDARRKAVIICPGGGYEFCSTREGEPAAFQFLAMDCQAFVLHYSTDPGIFPEALCELAAAVALIRRRAGEWHIEPNGICVCGFSAGGHLAASLGVFWNRDFLKERLGLKPEQMRPNGLILSYPVISSGEFGHAASFDNLTGRGISEFSREFLSLENQVGEQVPPVFMWHTDTDGTVPVENSLLFAWALKKAKVSLELHIYPQGRHGLALANEETDKVTDDGRGGYVVPCCQSWTELVKKWIISL